MWQRKIVGTRGTGGMTPFGLILESDSGLFYQCYHLAISIGKSTKNENFIQW
ncbi:hypothetical protein HanRHA438_Chr08g0372671 [Helianthus annuus]|nr:hypothetical protein HanRHA438_Chr08g0372671 [Helianthus annuus]